MKAAVLSLLEACRHDVLHLIRESNLSMDWFCLEDAYTQEVCLITLWKKSFLFQVPDIVQWLATVY